MPGNKKSILGFELKDEHIFLADDELMSRVEDLNRHEMARLVDLWRDGNRNLMRKAKRMMRQLPAFRERRGLPRTLPGDPVLAKLGRRPKTIDRASDPIMFLAVLRAYFAEVWSALERSTPRGEPMRRFVRRVAAEASKHRLRPSRQKILTVLKRRLPASKPTTPLSLSLDIVETMTRASRATLRRDYYRRLDKQ